MGVGYRAYVLPIDRYGGRSWKTLLLRLLKGTHPHNFDVSIDPFLSQGILKPLEGFFM